jgi:hypothetical protein
MADDEIPEKIEFHYQKSPNYRTIHADGAHGGPTARGYLAITFYNERATIPRRGVRDVSVDAEGQPKLSRERIEDSLEGVMRQLETTVMLDINAARELIPWLEKQLEALEDAFDVPADQRFSARGKK